MQYIYKITNLITNKPYIGITVNIQRRMQQHRAGHDAPQSPIDLSIQKYGWENFTVDIIDQCETREEAKQLEQHYIQIYNSYYDGYNATLGGDDVSNLPSVKGENNPRALITEDDVREIRRRRMNGERLSDVYKDYEAKMPGGVRNGFSKVWLHDCWFDVCPEYVGKYPKPDHSVYATKRRNQLTDNDKNQLVIIFKYYGPIKYNKVYPLFKQVVDWQTFQEVCQSIVDPLYGNAGYRCRAKNKAKIEALHQQYLSELHNIPVSTIPVVGE